MNFADTHAFKCFRTDGAESLWASACCCGGWISDIYLTRTEAKTAHVRHQAEWLRGLAGEPPAPDARVLGYGS